MTSFVYDFKDIAQRMKGELKAAPENEITLIGYNCNACEDTGWIIDPFTSRPFAFQECIYCGNPLQRLSP